MPVTAKPAQKVSERLGEEVTNELVDWFNSVDATYRADLRELNELNFARFEPLLRGERVVLEGRIDLSRRDLEAKIDQRTAELRQEILGLRADMDFKLEHLRSDLLKWMFLFWTGTALTVIGVMVGLR